MCIWQEYLHLTKAFLGFFINTRIGSKFVILTYQFCKVLLEGRVSQKTCPSSVVEMKCKQISIDDVRAPILPPDDLACLQRGVMFRIKKTCIVEAREAYKRGIHILRSRSKRRKYLLGSRYRDLFNGFYKVIDVREYGGCVDLNITIENGETSVLKIRDVSRDGELLQCLKIFNKEMDKSSIARCHSGDDGKMYAFGFHNSKEGNYKSMRDVGTDIRHYSTVARKRLQEYFHEEIHKIIKADRDQNIVPCAQMGGEQGISAYALVSEDLVNAAHYDLDTSVGISVFNELKPQYATNWNFVLPNTTLVNGKEHEASYSYNYNWKV